MKDQKVLATTRCHLNKIGYFNGISFDAEKYQSLFQDEENQILVPRDQAETESALKQIIPYVMILRYINHAPEILTYVRTKKSDEKRLRAKSSLGFGGHIEDFEIQDGLFRELNEELSADGDEFCSEIFRGTIEAIINDDSTDVGRVHLGLVVVIEIVDDALPIRSAEDKIELTGWKTIQQLKEETADWEDWSKFIIDNIDTIIENYDQQKGIVITE